MCVRSVHLESDNREPYKLVEIQPVVIFGILDHYMRREKDSERVIGTLLGTIEAGIVNVNSCFIVPHTEVQQVAVNIEFHQIMVKLHGEINPEEQIVGWFSTHKTDCIANSVLMNDFYWKEMNDTPVHIIVDPTFQGGELGVRCYFAHPIQLGERGIVQQQFRPLRYRTKTFQPDRMLLERMIQDKEKKAIPLSDLESLERLLMSLVEMLDRISTYIGSVTKGEKKGDTKFARLLDETLSLIPTDAAQYESLFTKGLQDVLMVVYLANLTRTQLLLLENNTERD